VAGWEHGDLSADAIYVTFELTDSSRTPGSTASSSTRI
jgi:hypothetical protein